MGVFQQSFAYDPDDGNENGVPGCWYSSIDLLIQSIESKS